MSSVGSATSSPKKGYDFTMNTSKGFATGDHSGFTFTPPRSTPPQPFNDPFVFGIEKRNVQKWVKDDSKVVKDRYVTYSK